MHDDKINGIDRLEISMNDLKILISDAVSAGRKAEKTDVRKLRNPNYSKTEDLLYKYPMLKLKVEQDELDIKDLEKEFKLPGGTQRSKDVVRIPNGGKRLDPQEKLQAFIEDKEKSRLKTVKEIERIDKALNKVKDYKGYEIIKLKYFDRLDSDEEIMFKIHIGKTAYYLWKNRIINDLSVIFFGE